MLPARARFIMRHENHPGGPGTRLLLNVALWSGMPVVRHSALETAVQFTTAESDGTMESFFLKVRACVRPV